MKFTETQLEQAFNSAAAQTHFSNASNIHVKFLNQKT
jgi:hypothetical protein